MVKVTPLTETGHIPCRFSPWLDDQPTVIAFTQRRNDSHCICIIE